MKIKVDWGFYRWNTMSFKESTFLSFWAITWMFNMEMIGIRSGLLEFLFIGGKNEVDLRDDFFYLFLYEGLYFYLIFIFNKNL